MASKCLLILLLCAWNTECVSARVDCKNVQYRRQSINQKEYINKCVPEQWRGFFRDMDQVVLGELADNLVNEGKYLKNAIEPKMPLLFEALKYVSPEEVKVVVLGQDPTPQEDKATGVAFHVDDPRSVPAVLNMFLEVAFEGFPVNLDEGDVTNWAKQGVLLLNTAFTCPHNLPNFDWKIMPQIKDEHLKMWKDFTTSLIKYIDDAANPSVWLLWGQKAKSFSKFISDKHLKIEGGHPSPVGIAIRGDSFFGGNYFNRANQFLSIKGRGLIDWSLSNSGLNSLTLTPPYWQQRQKQLSEEKEKIKILVELNKLKPSRKFDKMIKNKTKKPSRQLPLRINKAITKKKKKPNQGRIKVKLIRRLQQINAELNQLPLEQLKQHYLKMVNKIEEIQ